MPQPRAKDSAKKEELGALVGGTMIGTLVYLIVRDIRFCLMPLHGIACYGPEKLDVSSNFIEQKSI